MQTMEATMPAEKAKSLFTQRDSAHVPDKQIHRWEGEGGAEYLPRPRRRSEILGPRRKSIRG
ncbi:hypothetical protein JF732_24240 [Mycobacterium intracellulare]|uniref:Uncharacterized protein n=1 Tax=Mycobacterium intracellulare TaxID=1767 RepID=A0AAE4RGU3_MYCIT|nr:hypothetical protein [Mycobacterium intracellulare]MCA2322778.1 hypothetical protein [Mycobacterium intracellulare]MCA2343637.1 hypothetical protein [Mycobacterium intracellulare]MDV6978398.1 hypothetical protein [Mycobacterium intracellulare]MDV6983812.1 hypothetical protein [Mycobacterium intracellulare]MDV7015616.1 hypothetical protein [Mycobacterium intracellulare]